MCTMQMDKKKANIGAWDQFDYIQMPYGCQEQSVIKTYNSSY